VTDMGGGEGLRGNGGGGLVRGLVGGWLGGWIRCQWEEQDYAWGWEGTGTGERVCVMVEQAEGEELCSVATIESRQSLQQVVHHSITLVTLTCRAVECGDIYTQVRGHIRNWKMCFLGVLLAFSGTYAMLLSVAACCLCTTAASLDPPCRGSCWSGSWSLIGVTPTTHSSQPPSSLPSKPC